MGDSEICPNPTSEAAQARIFNNVAAMLNDSFTFARNHLGMKTAVGTETPRNSWFSATMSADADQSETYENAFKRIQAAYPIDLWWSWTPEGYIWSDGSSSPIGSMVGAPAVASSCPFDKDTSRYGGVAGQWQNTYIMNASSSEVFRGAAQTETPFSLTLAHPSPLQSGNWCLQPCSASGSSKCHANDSPSLQHAVRSRVHLSNGSMIQAPRSFVLRLTARCAWRQQPVHTTKVEVPTGVKPQR
eukprot:SAG31_NODE_1008_length_10407_cov_2.369131_3_plen_244_part_00